MIPIPDEGGQLERRGSPVQRDRWGRARVGVNPWLTLAVLSLSLVTIVLNNTVLNVALPTLVRELSATNTQLQWIVGSYGLVLAGFLLTAGALGDRFGRKGALVIGLVIFGGGSLASTLAPSANHLIATRSVMGLGAALVTPATLSLLTSVFPPDLRGRAIALWAGIGAAGAVLGPITGGWLLDNFYWGSVFFINVPTCVVAIAAVYWLVPTSRDPQRAALDPVGAVLSILGFAALLYGIIEAPTYGWTHPLVIGAFITSVVSVVAFCIWELRVENPMLDLRFFKDERFSAASVVIALVIFALFGNFFLLTQYLQAVRDYSALEAGVRMLPNALALMMMLAAADRFVRRFGPQRVVSFGLVVLGTGFVLAAAKVGISTPYGWLVGALIIIAAGTSLSLVPATNCMISSLPSRKAGVGSAWNFTTAQLGGALGVAVLGSLGAARYVSSLREDVRSIPGEMVARAEGSVGAALQASSELHAPLGAHLADTARAAFVDAMGLTFASAAVIAFVASIAITRYLPTKREVESSTRQEEVPTGPSDREFVTAIESCSQEGRDARELIGSAIEPPQGSELEPSQVFRER